MKRTLIAGAALLACAAPASAHNAGLTIDCDGASVAYSYFPTYRDSVLTSTITLDGQVIHTQDNTVRRNGTINIPLTINGTHVVGFNVSWQSDTNGSKQLTDTIECPVYLPPPVIVPPAPPVVPPAPTPEPPPQVTTPVPPTPPVPPKPKPRITCQDLILKRAGENTLRKHGCARPPLKTCPATKQRVIKAGKVVCIPKRRIVPVTG